MSDITVTIAGVEGTAPFTNAQAEKFIPPLLRRHGWPGETVWSAMTAQDRIEVCTFVAKLLIHEAVRVARQQMETEGSASGATTATNDYDTVIGLELLTKPTKP